MKVLRIVVLPVALAIFFGMYSSVAECEPALPILRPIVKSLCMGKHESVPNRSWWMSMEWKIENTSSWNIAWYEHKQARVTVVDSLGSRAANISYYYDNRDRRLVLHPKGWLPGMGARWVHVKGVFPFAVASSETDAETVPLTVKFIKGFSLHVVLKGAGLPGADGRAGDVTATLKLRECRKNVKEGTRWLDFVLESEMDFGLRTLQLQSLNGDVVTPDWRGMMIGYHGQWDMECNIPDVPENEIRVVIRYMQAPRLVNAVVDARVALSGLINEGGEGRADSSEGKRQAVAKGGSDASGMPVPVPETKGTGKTVIMLEPVGMSVNSGEHGAGQEFSPMQMKVDVRMAAEKAIAFCRRVYLGEQYLTMTDSTGRILRPVVVNMGNLLPSRNDGVSYAVVTGSSREMPSQGAEWVRLKGTLLVPVAQIKESPVYELPLKDGAFQHIPMPGWGDSERAEDDVATVEYVSPCKLWLELVKQDEPGERQVRIHLSVEGKPFDFDSVELVDRKGSPLKEGTLQGVSGFGNEERREWIGTCWIKNVDGMKDLRVKIKYRGEMKMVSVPVDMKVGLGGPLP